MKSSRLWSLLDMLKFYAHEFSDISRGLACFRISLRNSNKTEPLIPEGSWPKMKASDIQISCQNIGLNLSAIQCGRLIDLINKVEPFCSPESIDQAIAEVDSRINDELQTLQFFSLSTEEQKFYEPTKPLFGTEVSDKFPSASFDIDEAGKCIALGRHTASVFHLMRVMEIALHAVHACLGCTGPIAGNDKTWGSILQAIRTEYRERKGFAEFDLFQEFHTLLDSVRNAWRNGTMHVEKTYTEDEAKVIFLCVKGYMTKLASRMNEKGLPLAS